MPDPIPTATPLTPPATPKDLELERLQRELLRAEAEAKIAEQRTKALTQSFPASETKTLEASTTVDANVVIESEILAYEMLRHVAKRIAIHVSGLVKGKAIVIHNDADMAALALFRTFRTQLQQLAEAFKEVLPKPEGAESQLESVLAVPAAVLMMKSVIDLLAFFRTQRAVAGVSIAMDDMPFIAGVGGVLANLPQPLKVYIPTVYPLPGDGSGIASALDMVRSSAIAAAARVKAETDQARKAVAEQSLALMEQTRKGYEDFVTHSDGSAAIATLVRGASMDKLLNAGDGACVLYLRVLKAAGTNETKKSLFGSNLKHSGGVVVNYMLFHGDGSLLAANTDDAYSGERGEIPPTDPEGGSR